MTTKKCVIVGDGAVGKTSLLVSYTKNYFPDGYFPKLSETSTESVLVCGMPVSLQIFDTHGQEDYDRLRTLTYPDTWLPEVKRYCPTARIILVGTKMDLRDNQDNPNAKNEKSISFIEGMKMKKQIGAACYLECSSLTKQGLKTIFDEAIRVAISTPTKTTCHNCQLI